MNHSWINRGSSGEVSMKPETQERFRRAVQEAVGDEFSTEVVLSNMLALQHGGGGYSYHSLPELPGSAVLVRDVEQWIAEVVEKESSRLRSGIYPPSHARQMCVMLQALQCGPKLSLDPSHIANEVFSGKFPVGSVVSVSVSDALDMVADGVALYQARLELGEGVHDDRSAEEKLKARVREAAAGMERILAYMREDLAE